MESSFVVFDVSMEITLGQFRSREVKAQKRPCNDTNIYSLSLSIGTLQNLHNYASCVHRFQKHPKHLLSISITNNISAIRRTLLIEFNIHYP